MDTLKRSTLLSPVALLAVAIALSIGWGIRGNFGHEYGAMIPGALAALAACIASQRVDWWKRAPYFALFGALGWAFGGSISYMQVIAYTHSGHLPTQVYGFFCLWVIGFLWAGLGGAGTALPAVLSRERLIGLLTPLAWIGSAWFLFTAVLMPSVTHWESDFARTWSRHESPLYWFDSDWLQALVALVALGAYDLWERRRRQIPTRALLLACALALLGTLFAGADGIQATVAVLSSLLLLYVLAGTPLLAPALWGLAGAIAGATIQALLSVTGLAKGIAWLLVWPQGDLEKLHALAQEHGIPYEEALGQTLNNWPEFFSTSPQHIGWLIGLTLAGVVYFRKTGRFPRDAGLFAAMAGSWLLCFLALPVLFNFGGAGLRMTPPRGDDWAGILGVWLGAMWWLQRNRATPVVVASLVCGAIGGLGFGGAVFIKLMFVSLGNPALVSDPTWRELFAHYQSANWHSLLEQTYGFLNGIGLAVALGLLASRKATLQDEPRCTQQADVWAIALSLFGVLFLNMFKNVREWVDREAVPPQMTAPWFANLTLSSEAWFVLFYAVVCIAGAALLFSHQRRPIALVPESPLGRAQLLLIAMLWGAVVMNFERALVNFSEARLLTEGVVLLNAVLLSVLLLRGPSAVAYPAPAGLYDYAPLVRRAAIGLVLAALLTSTLFPVGVRWIYGETPAGHAGLHKRFGPDASWRVAPLLKGDEHR